MIGFPMDKPKDKLKVKPRVRKETQNEYTERTLWENEDTNMPKPKHMDNSLIVREEDWGKRPKPFKNDDPSTYLVNQKKTLNSFEVILESAKNPRTKEDRKTANEFKRMINKDYYNPKTREFLGDDELKFIGKHPSQRVKTEIKIPTIDINYKPFKPEPELPTLAEAIKNSSRIKPGLSEDLLSINAEIKKNIDYVLGKKEERLESENEKNNNNEENEND